MHFPKTSNASARVPEEGHCQPTPLQETLTHSQIGLAQCSVGSLFLSRGSWCAQVLFVPYKSGVSISLSPLKVLQSNPAGLQSQIPWGFSVPLPDPQAQEPDVGPRIFTKVQELLWYYFLHSVGHSPGG